MAALVRHRTFLRTVAEATQRGGPKSLTLEGVSYRAARSGDNSGTPDTRILQIGVMCACNNEIFRPDFMARAVYTRRTEIRKAVVPQREGEVVVLQEGTGAGLRAVLPESCSGEK